MPIFHLDSAYRDTWVVLDRSLRVVDSGDHLEPLRRKHGAETRRTFCFVSGAQDATRSRPRAPWSLRGLLGHPPLTLANVGATL
jgi:hypothetical protein